jgi:hypothetical protein
MKDGIKKVCIVTNFRAASTALTLLKAEEYDIPYVGELFSHEKPFNIGSTVDLRPKEKTHERYIQELRENKDLECCFKLMPQHAQFNVEMIGEILATVDKVYYLYRSDFKGQLISYMANRGYGREQETGFKTKTSPANRQQRARELVLGELGKTKQPVIIKMSLTDPQLAGNIGGISMPTLRHGLIRNYEVMAAAYRLYPGELIRKEDYFSGERYNPYNRFVEWKNGEVVEIEDFNVDALFK